MDSESDTACLPPLPKKKAIEPKERKKKNSGQVVSLPPIDGKEKNSVDAEKASGDRTSRGEQTVVKFRGTPTQYPYSICFQFPNTFITHRYVLDLVKEKIHFVPGGGITDIQFVDRNVMHGTRGLDNRWVVSLTSVEARDELMRLGIVMFNKKILLRRYDDVLQEEYKEFQDWDHMRRKMYARLHGLPWSSDSEEDKDKDKEEEDSDDDTKKKKKRKKKKGKHKDDDKKDKAKKEED